MPSTTVRSSQPQALTILLEASSLLLNAGNEQQILTQTLDLARGLLVADAYGVWRQDESGSTWRIIAQRGLSSSYPTSVAIPATSAMQDVWIMEDMLSDQRALFDRSVYVKEGIRSAMLVPWTLQGAVSGAIIYYCRQPRTFSPNDVDYARALSNLSASALNRLELQQQSQQVQRRLRFLAEASAVLSSSLDYESTLQHVAELAVAQIADWCTVHVDEGGAMTRLAVRHADPAMISLAELYSREYPEQILPDSGVGLVIRTGEPELVSPITDAMVRAAAQDDRHLQLLQQFQLSSSIVVPLRSRDRTLGAIRLLGTGGRHFSSGDLELALDLGRRAATAIENAQLHRTLLDQATELQRSHAAAKMGSWSWDIARNKLTWSAEFKALHGLPPEAEANPDWSYELVHPEDRARAQQEFHDTLASLADVFHSEHRAVTPDGRVLWLQVRGYIRRNAQGQATWVAGLIIDVTDSRLAEQALRRAEKLAAAGRLAATVAHEVNNPLASLVNLVYLAEHTAGLPAEAAQHLQLASSELRRIAHIVRQTLGFYRESTVPRPTHIHPLVVEVLEIYQSRASSRGITLVAPPAPQQPLVSSLIAGEIQQLLSNLIANAIDATPPGGTVTAALHRFDSAIEITVSDTGSGVPEANRRRLFEPFFTTKEDVGTGLGLWVSRGIAEKHGGTLTLDPAGSVDTPGTTFRLHLPL